MPQDGRPPANPPAIVGRPSGDSRAEPDSANTGSPLAAGAPPATLVVLDPSGQRRRVKIESIPFTIGRQADNHLVLRDNRASREHARIIVENAGENADGASGGAQYVIEDLESSHGTWVNAQKIVRHVLKHGDRIDLGVEDSYQVTVELGGTDIQRLLSQVAGQGAVGSGTSALGATPGRGTGEGTSDSNLGKLRSLMEVARALQNSLSTREVLTAVIDAALSVTGCERGFLLLRAGEELEVSVARDRHGRPLAAGDLRVPTGLIHKALNSRRDLLSMSFDPLAEAGARPEMTVAKLELQSVVCLPLVQVRSGSLEETSAMTTERATVGLLYMDSRDIRADLSGGSRELLQTLAMEASTILENARLLEEERVKLRMEGELQIARDIQQSLVPVEMPGDGWFRAAGSTEASTEVGGDYFDVHHLVKDRWSAVVTDVSGKGVSSALLAGFLQGAFLMSTGESADMPGMVSRLNRFLLERTRGEKYATIFYCVMDSSGGLRYVNAGHCAPYLLHPNGDLRKLATNGMPVGMLEEAEYQVDRVQLEAGDKVVIFSDGLTEAENAEGEFFDAQRLKLFLRDHRHLGAAALHQSLRETIARFSEGGMTRDDVTALVLEYAPEG